MSIIYIKPIHNFIEKVSLRLHKQGCCENQIFRQARHFHEDGKLTYFTRFAQIRAYNKIHLECIDDSDATSISDDSDEEDNISENGADLNTGVGEVIENRPEIDEDFLFNKRYWD